MRRFLWGRPPGLRGSSRTRWWGRNQTVRRLRQAGLEAGRRPGGLPYGLAILAAIAVAATGPPAVTFTDVTTQAGIRFTHNAGKAGKKLLPETLGAGCAFLDYDGDGWPDILLINSKDWTPRGRRSLPALYHNNH